MFLLTHKGRGATVDKKKQVANQVTYKDNSKLNRFAADWIPFMTTYKMILFMLM